MMKKTISSILAGLLCVSVLASCAQAPAVSSASEGSTPATTDSSAATSALFDTTQVVHVVSREDGSGTRGAFIELFGIEEKDASGNKTDRTTKEATIASKTDIMMTTVSSDPYAIGYISLGSVNDTIKPVAIDGVEASAENVKNGTYKISRPFNIATKAEVSPVTQDFMDFILSKEGQEVVAKSYIAVDDAAKPYAGTKPAGKIVVAGSSSVTPVMEKLKEAYLLINPNATVEVQMSDSTGGMTGAMDGTCDIGMASRSLKDSEKAALTGTEIALDGIAVIVNNDNPVADLAAADVKTIFTSDETNWDQLA